MTIKALVFDFDGLILDTEGPVFQSWQELFQKYDYYLTLDDWQVCIGSQEGTNSFFSNLGEKLDGSFDMQAEAPKRLERELELIAAQPLLPGVLEYIQGATGLGLKLGIASSSPCQWVLGHLEERGIRDYFECVLAADDVHVTKPDPSLYTNVLRYLNVSAHQAIAFEDSPNGILAAKRAGLYCVAVPNPLTRQLQIETADLQLNSLEDLPLKELLARFEGVNQDIG